MGTSAAGPPLGGVADLGTILEVMCSWRSTNLITCFSVLLLLLVNCTTNKQLFLAGGG